MSLSRKLLQGANPSSGGSGYSFNMTAGNYPAFGLTGYSYPAAFNIGTIDAEPVPTNELIIFVSNTSNITGMSFNGDIAALLTGLTVWVGGVQYATGFSGWGYDGEATGGDWSPGDGPVFVDGNSYFVEIK